MKKVLGILSLLLIASGISATLPHDTYAVSGSDFKAGYIIDDAIFYNENAMDAPSIQSFLNARVPNCDTNGAIKATEFGRSDLTHAQYAALKGWQSPPYTCLKDYRQDVPAMEGASGYCNAINPSSSQTGAQIISLIAKACHINPQVLVILLQKEQSLILDTWPLNSQYTKATGFACSDTAPCNAAYGGFFYQVYYAARQFQVYKKNPNNYNYVAGRYNNIYYNPSLSSCGSSQVYIQNQATAALYIYTPYQPNTAALNNLYGTGDGCSSYGNRNFWRLFNDWFGSTTIQVYSPILETYNRLNGAAGILGKATMNKVCELRNDGCYQGFANGGIYWSGATGAYESYGVIRTRYMQIKTEDGVLGYPTGSVQCGLVGSGCYQTYQGGVMYYAPAVSKAFEVTGAILTHYGELKSENSVLGYPTGAAVCGLVNNGCFQGFQTGGMYYSPSTGAHTSYGPIRQKYIETGTESGTLGYPTSDVVCGLKNNGCYQIFQKGTIFWSQATGAKTVVGAIYSKWDAVSKEWGSLGYPITDESPVSGYNTQTFENGIIYQKGSTSRIILNSIKTRWDELNGVNGKLGFPDSDTQCGTKNNGCYQMFNSGNTIFWSQATGAKTVWGAIYSKWNELGKEWGSLGYPTSNEYYVGGTAKQDFQGGTINWSSTRGAWVE